jgi:hypothetical protein
MGHPRLWLGWNKRRVSHPPEGATNAEKLNGLEKQIAEHEEKLANYKSNPDAYDNKGILKNASPERRQSIINGRIKHLEREIEAFKKSLNGK